MSTSLLYHLFGLRGYDCESAKYVKDEVHFCVKPKADLLCCSCCQSYKVKRRGFSERKIRLLGYSSKALYVLLKVPRLECKICGAIRLMRLKFADAKRSYSRSFERLVVQLSKEMSLFSVAKFLKVGWDCVKDIVKRNLAKRFQKPKLRHLKRLAIDEIYVGKRQKYLTLVLDLESGAVVFVGEGKGADALVPFWRRLKKSRAKIEAISTDLSPAYIFAVRTYCPEAVLVFDYFHIIKLMNEQLSDLRRKLFHELKGPLEKKVLKGTRWLLLKNPENLEENHNEKQRLSEALELNQPLATAYYMKEDLRQIWTQENKEAAGEVLDSWIKTAQTSEIFPLMKMGKTLAKHRDGILNWYDFPISSGPMEGTNNKIKTLKRQAYGYRDLEFFKLRIMAIHQAKYAFAG